MIEIKDNTQRKITSNEAEILLHINDELGFIHEYDDPLSDDWNEFDDDEFGNLKDSVIEISFDNNVEPICYGSYYLKHDVMTWQNLYLLPQAIPYLRSKNRAEVTRLNNGKLIVITLNGRELLHEQTIKIMQDNKNEYTKAFAEPIDMQSLPPNYFVHQFLRTQTKVEGYAPSAHNFMVMPIFYGLLFLFLYTCITKFNIYFAIFIIFLALFVFSYKNNKSNQRPICLFQGLVYPLLINTPSVSSIYYLGILGPNDKLKNLSIPRGSEDTVSKLVMGNTQPIAIEYLGDKNEIYQIVTAQGTLSFANTKMPKFWLQNLLVMLLSISIGVFFHFNLNTIELLDFKNDEFTKQNAGKSFQALKEQINEIKPLSGSDGRQLLKALHDEKFILNGYIGCRIEKKKTDILTDTNACGMLYLIDKHEVDEKYALLNKIQSNFGKLRLTINPMIYKTDNLKATDNGFKLELSSFSTTLINPQIIETLYSPEARRYARNHFYFSSGASELFLHVDELCEYLTSDDCVKLKEMLQEQFLFNTIADNRDWEAMKKEILVSPKELKGNSITHLDTPEKEFIFFQFSSRNFQTRLEYFHGEAIKNINQRILDDVVSVDASLGYLININGEKQEYNLMYADTPTSEIGKVRLFQSEIKFAIEDLRI